MLLRPGEVNREKHWFEFHNLDKIVHFLIFTVLGFCYSVSFPKQKKWLFVVVMFVYALFTEVAQGLMNMGRTMDFYDLIADMMGAGFGCFLFWQILSYIEKRKWRMILEIQDNSLIFLTFAKIFRDNFFR